MLNVNSSFLASNNHPDGLAEFSGSPHSRQKSLNRFGANAV
jgi:hypothetical protein